MIIEILSLNNTNGDIRQKFDSYQENGVPEYWIVFPYDEVVQVHDLVDGKYQLRNNYCKEDIINTKCLNGFELDLKEVFYH